MGYARLQTTRRVWNILRWQVRTGCSRGRWRGCICLIQLCTMSAAWLERRGGGRFDGHPTAALLARASCVLSSVHALWDDTAAEFNALFYSRVLDAKNPLPLGDALLETRREMAEKHRENPLVWAMTVLWGNPWARLAYKFRGTVKGASGATGVSSGWRRRSRW